MVDERGTVVEDLVLDEGLLQGAQRLSRRMLEHNISLYLTGLAASGKSTVAAYISRLTGIPIVDTGLPFRLATYLNRTIPASALDRALFDRLLNSHSIRVVAGEYRVFSGETDITDRLRSTEIDRDVPMVAGDPTLRTQVLDFLRRTTTGPSIVAARGATEPFTRGHILQLELSASFNCRVQRRSRQGDLPGDTVRRSIRERDRRDLQGAARYPAPDIIDTTHLTLEESIARVIARANERIIRLYEYQSFRRFPLSDALELENPFLAAAWDASSSTVSELEERYRVPAGQTRGRYLLRLSRRSPREIFGDTASAVQSWAPGSFPNGGGVSDLIPDHSLLSREAEQAVRERRQAIDAFFSETKLPRAMLQATTDQTVERRGSTLIAQGGGEASRRLILRDASPQLGFAIEKYLHYLANPRVDCTHRLVLVEEHTDLPVLYLSFASNSRKYTEPLLWALGLRMEEVVVAVRGYGSPRCPRNAMGLFLRSACQRVGEDFPHLRAVLTDINPNWGYSGQSFREAGFIDIGLKYAPTAFVGDEYISRRELDKRNGAKAATSSRMPVLPTLIMIRPMNRNEELSNKLQRLSHEGLFVIPRSLYDQG